MLKITTAVNLYPLVFFCYEKKNRLAVKGYHRPVIPSNNTQFGLSC